MNNHVKTLILFSLLCAFSNVQAQFISSEQSGSTTVQEIKQHAFHLSWTDQKITVKGFIVEQIDDEDYWFEDKTGRIKVEIPRKFMPAIPFDQKTEVALSG